MSGPDVLISAAYLLLIMAPFARGLLVLRVMLFVASVGFVVFGFVADVRSMVAWNSIIALMHAITFARQFRATRARLSSEEERVRSAHFASLPRSSFAALAASARVVTADRGTVLIRQGAPPDGYRLIVAGSVAVRRDDELVATLGPGSLIGEMGASSGSAANADCVASDASELWWWASDDLERLDNDCPAARLALQQHVARDLVAKLDAATPRSAPRAPDREVGPPAR